MWIPSYSRFKPFTALFHFLEYLSYICGHTFSLATKNRLRCPTIKDNFIQKIYFLFNIRFSKSNYTAKSTVLMLFKEENNFFCSAS